MKYVARAQEVIDIELAGLQKLRDTIGPEFSRAVGLLLEGLNRGGKIVVTGLGKSFHIGQKMAATFTSTGTPAVVLHPSEAMHGDLGILRAEDILLAISFSGSSEELLQLIPQVKRIGLKIVAITGDAKSAVAQHSDEVIPIPIEREACPFNMAPTTSTTATLVMGDALAMVLLEARGFKIEDYAKLHPGGAIGRTLLLRVSDIMRSGDRLAKVSLEARVKDAVLAMTSARAGAVAVVDGRDRLAGIFTDGDLRRHIQEGVNLAELPVAEVMTANPVTLTADHLAVDVLALFEKYNIDDLLIVDRKKRLVGMVDLQDLPKLKIL